MFPLDHLACVAIRHSEQVAPHSKSPRSARISSSRTVHVENSIGNKSDYRHGKDIANNYNQLPPVLQRIQNVPSCQGRIRMVMAARISSQSSYGMLSAIDLSIHYCRKSIAKYADYKYVHVAIDLPVWCLLIIRRRLIMASRGCQRVRTRYFFCALSAIGYPKLPLPRDSLAC
jgi:hypothetical protein